MHTSRCIRRTSRDLAPRRSSRRSEPARCTAAPARSCELHGVDVTGELRNHRPMQCGRWALGLALLLCGADAARAHRLSAVTHGDSDVTTLVSDDFVEAHGEIGIAGPAANYVVGDAQVDSATGRSQISVQGSRAGGGTFINLMEADTQLRQWLAVEDPTGSGSIRATLTFEATGSIDAAGLGQDAEIEAQLWLSEFCRITVRERFDFDGADLPVVGPDCDELYGTASYDGGVLTVEVDDLSFFDDIEVRVFLSGDLSIIPVFSGELSAEAALEVEALGGATFDPESDTFLTEVPEPGATVHAVATLGSLGAMARRRSRA